MTTLSPAYVSILPSTDDLAPGIRRALGAAEDRVVRGSDERSGAAYSSGFKGAVGGILKGGVIAAAGGASLLAGLGVKTAAEMETANIAFTTMLGSADKAKTFIGELTDFAAKTPFEFPGLQTAASSLISAGIATKDVLPIMETLGNVTSGMGTGADGIQRATVALQQMNAAGRITGEDLNQLRDAGIPVYDLLAAATGKSKAEVTALAQAGKLGATELGQMMEALKSGAGLERFNGLMEKQSASLSGMWSTFKDTLQMGMADAILPLIPMLKDGLGAAAEALPPIIKTLASALAETIDVVSSVVGWFKEHETTATVLGAALVGLAAGALAYSGVMKLAGLLTREAADETKKTGARVRLNPVGGIVAVLAALAIVVFIAWKRSDTFRAVVTGALDGVKGAASSVGRFFTETIPGLVGKASASAGRALGWVRSNWRGLFGILAGPLLGAGAMVVAAGPRITAAAGRAKDWIVSKWSALIGFAKGIPGKLAALPKMFDGMKQAVGDVLDDVVGVFNRLPFDVDFSGLAPGVGSAGSSGEKSSTVAMFAAGGIVTEPTLGVFGEAGPEAVMPLEDLGKMLATVASDGARYDDPAALAAYRARQTGPLGDALHNGGRIDLAFLEDGKRRVFPATVKKHA